MAGEGKSQNKSRGKSRSSEWTMEYDSAETGEQTGRWRKGNAIRHAVLALGGPGQISLLRPGVTLSRFIQTLYCQYLAWPHTRPQHTLSGLQTRLLDISKPYPSLFSPPTLYVLLSVFQFFPLFLKLPGGKNISPVKGAQGTEGTTRQGRQRRTGICQE